MSILDTAFQLSGSTMRLSVPLLFAAMAGIMSERSGIINIALEGFILFGAFFAALATLSTGSAWAGLGLAAVVGILIAALYALMVIWLRADQIVTGTAINMLAFGTTPLLSKVFFSSGGGSPSIEIAHRFQVAPLFLAGALIIGMHFWLTRTPSGLWVQFAGEHPEALACAGIRLRRVRFAALLCSGALAAVAGATLSIYLSSSFSRGMSAGRGFMALAAIIFGRWRPVPAALACLLFGFTDALQMQLQGITFPGFETQIPVQLIQIAPYVATIIVLATFVGRAYAPTALGKAIAAE